jgi:dipeptidyl aminopeptidase/acylaminoacyl peptidase
VTPTPSITPTPTPVVTQYDVTIEPQLSPDLKPEGVLVVVSQNYNAAYLLDLPSARKQLLLGGKILIPFRAELAISPDRKRLAYIALTNTSHFVTYFVTADGHQQSVRPSPNNQFEVIIDWLDNERLLIAEDPQDDGTVIVFDPLTQELQEVAPVFPAVSSQGKIGDFDNSGKPSPIYDPTLTRTVINRYLNHNKYELWDVQSKKILWERFVGGYQSRPIWSPDGTRFGVVYDPVAGSGSDTNPHGALYVIDRDGRETRLTDFVAGAMTWSPDGRFIATWWRRPPYGEDLIPLTVVDTAGKEVALYVLTNGFTPLDQYPVWSPDGQWIAFNALVGTNVDETTPNSVVVLNIAQRRAFEVAKNVVARGWMAATP